MNMTKGEQFNVLTSLLGAAAAAPGVAVLIALAAHQEDPWKIVSFSIYGGALLLLYSIAALYHAVQGKLKPLFRELDHDAIYLLIAGTYTPFSLVILRGIWGWTLLGLVWGFAIFGIVQTLLPSRWRLIPELAIYVGMGWLVLIAIGPLLHAISWQGVAWLGTGGVFYTGGIVFYNLDRRFSWAHGCWHLCVLAGSASHYLVVLRYVA
jgi:hemolysin III